MLRQGDLQRKSSQMLNNNHKDDKNDVSGLTRDVVAARLHKAGWTGELREVSGVLVTPPHALSPTPLLAFW